MAENRRSPEEIAKSLDAAKRMKAKETLAEQKRKIKSARYALLVVGILQCGVGLWEFYGLDLHYLVLIIDGGIGLVFIGLFFYAAENPKAAFMTGLITYIVIHLALAILDPVSIIQGIILKAIIISVLIGGLNAIKRIPKSMLDKREDDELLDSASQEII